MRDERHGTEAWAPEEQAGLIPLGPPGWEEFQAARRRFETSMERLGAEQSASRAMPSRRVITVQEVARRWG